MVDTVLDLLDNLWRKLSKAQHENAAHAAHVFSQHLRVHMLCHEVGRILGAQHIAQDKSALPKRLLRPERLGIQGANPPRPLSAGYFNCSARIWVQVSPELISKVLSHSHGIEGF